MSSSEFESLMETYTVIYPLEAWSTKDLVALSLAIDSELQTRAFEAGDPWHLS